MNTTIHQSLVVLTVLPALEEAVIDWLISRPDSSGFSSTPIHGHGSRHDALDPVEQVTGRQRRIQFQITMEESQVESFLRSVELEFKGAELHYWVVPLSASGNLGKK